METSIHNLGNLFNIAAKIKTPISLAALVILVIFAVIYFNPPILLGVIAICAVSIIAIICFIADIKRGTQPKEDVNTPVNISKDLRVKEEIWRNLDVALNANGFTERERNDCEELMGESYEFSWAGGTPSLFIVQVKSGELSPATVLQLRGMKSELESKRKEEDIRKIVIVCDAEQIFDALYHSVSGSSDLALLTHYSIDKIKEKDAGSVHLQKLLFEA
jgi:hypothetical protein